MQSFKINVKIFGVRAHRLRPLAAAAALLSALVPATAAPVHLAAVAAGQPAPPRPQMPGLSRDIHAYVQPGLQDFTVTLRTGRYDKKAGEQISKEFGQLYKVAGNGTLHYKQPDMIRLDGKVLGLNGVLVMDGFTQHIRIGFIHKNQDESQAPGKVTTLLDTGLLNEFYLSYADARFQGVQPVEGTPCAVFRLSYAPRMHDTSFRLVWIDPNTRIIRRREEHGQDGALHAVYTFRNPVLTAGVWLPSEVDAANAQGEFVGQTFIQDARPNTGLTDHLFR